MLYLHFTETPTFIKRASKILGEDEIENLQLYLNENPAAGEVIRSSGGIRKMRWSASGRGKRGGSRVIYYFALSHGRILLLDIYSKNEKSDLSRSEISNLNRELEVSFDASGRRNTTYVLDGVRRAPKSVYAVCVKVDDPDHLTLSKLYRIEISGEYAAVKDNQGEVSVYPVDFFLQLPLSRVTKTQIAAALSI